MKELVLKGIFEGVQVLESSVALDVPDEVIFIVARIIATAKKVGVRVGWLDKVINDKCVRRDHLITLLKAL